MCHNDFEKHEEEWSPLVCHLGSQRRPSGKRCRGHSRLTTIIYAKPLRHQLVPRGRGMPDVINCLFPDVASSYTVFLIKL
jgi:hypothetical protein